MADAWIILGTGNAVSLAALSGEAVRCRPQTGRSLGSATPAANTPHLSFAIPVRIGSLGWIPILRRLARERAVSAETSRSPVMDRTSQTDPKRSLAPVGSFERRCPTA